MIVFFPAPYPDELVYSWFARYAVRTGYTTYRAVAEDLFVSNTAKPNLEFIMELNKEAYKAVTAYKPFEEIVMKHTMFPYYARFLPKERRHRAFQLLMEMDNDFNNALYSRRSKTQCRQALRYCPICAKEDRKQYGETYWHRIHQLDHVDICPVHGCQLYNSVVDITSRPSPSLIHAEVVVPSQADGFLFGSDLALKTAKYTTQVFLADMDMDNDISVGRFLHSRMEHTKYLSPRGEKRNLTLIASDFAAYYKDLAQSSINEAWQIEKIFSNHQLHTYDICLLALFLNVPAADLVKMTLPEKTQAERFDDQILSLHAQGLNYRQISIQMGASYDYCKLVAKRRLKTAY